MVRCNLDAFQGGYMPNSSKSTLQAAATITRDNRFWGDAEGNPVTELYYAFASSAPSYVDSTFTNPNFLTFQLTQITATQSILDLWSDVANIEFKQVNPGG